MCSLEFYRKCEFIFGNLIVLKASTIQVFSVYNVLSTVIGVLRSHNIHIFHYKAPVL